MNRLMPEKTSSVPNNDITFEDDIQFNHVWNTLRQFSLKGTIKIIHKKISQANCLLCLRLIVFISKRNQCAQGPSDSQQNRQCRDMNPNLYLKFVNFGTPPHYFRFNTFIAWTCYVLHIIWDFLGLQKIRFPQLFWPLVCKYCLHSSQEVGQIAGPCQTKVQKHNFSCIQWKEIFGSKVQIISNLKVWSRSGEVGEVTHYNKLSSLMI